MRSKKIQSLNQLKKTVGALKKRGKKIGFTNGCFDLLHYGHIKYLKAAKMACDVLIVAVNSDASISRIKGKNRPLTRLKQRIGILAELEPIDYLVSFGQATPYRLIKTLKPDVLIKGADWKREDIVGKDIVESYKGAVITVAYDKSFSTTRIIKEIAAKFKNK